MGLVRKNVAIYNRPIYLGRLEFKMDDLTVHSQIYFDETWLKVRDVTRAVQLYYVPLMGARLYMNQRYGRQSSTSDQVLLVSG